MELFLDYIPVRDKILLTNDISYIAYIHLY